MFAARTVKVRAEVGTCVRARCSPSVAHRSVGPPRTVEGAELRQAQHGPLAAATCPAHRGKPGVCEARSRLAGGHRGVPAAQQYCDPDGEAAGSSGQGKKRQHGAS